MADGGQAEFCAPDQLGPSDICLHSNSAKSNNAVCKCDVHAASDRFNQQQLHIVTSSFWPSTLFALRMPAVQCSPCVSSYLQMAVRGDIADVFSLCFGSVEGDGALMLGDVDLEAFGVELNYTQLLSSEAHPHYYCVDLEAIEVADEVLPVPKVSNCMHGDCMTQLKSGCCCCAPFAEPPAVVVVSMKYAPHQAM